MFIETKIAIRYLAWTLIPALLLFPSVFGRSNTLTTLDFLRIINSVTLSHKEQLIRRLFIIWS
ncbi:hypothetical protein CPC08DRAFT_716602, partial [Agrocybe pediades]